MKWRKPVLYFLIGGGSYAALELAYRRRTHVSMFAAGGLCFLLLGKLRKARLPYVAKLAAGAGTVTAVELAAGLLVNRKHTVWDYRKEKGNVLGQICPKFTLLWIPLSAAAMAVYGGLEAVLKDN